jgi:tetratricopeptide (TPR) repeat protein
MNYLTGFAFALLIVALSIVVYFMIGHPLVRKLAGGFANSLYWPSDDKFRIIPEYSRAESRVKQGRISEAIVEYQNIIEQHPNDVYPHLRIAELAIDKLKDLQMAERELQSAFAKATGNDTMALVAGRLADLYQFELHDSTRALEVMKRLCERLPGTKQSRLAEARITILLTSGNDTVLPAQLPKKIALRPSRFKLTE